MSNVLPYVIDNLYNVHIVAPVIYVLIQLAKSPPYGRELSSFARWRHKVLHAGLSTILMAGRQLNPPSSGCPWRKMGARWGPTYLKPKDSNAAIGVPDRATQKAPKRYDRQTDKETNKLSAHHSEKIGMLCNVA